MFSHFNNKSIKFKNVPLFLQKIKIVIVSFNDLNFVSCNVISSFLQFIVLTIIMNSSMSSLAFLKRCKIKNKLTNG